jgi:myo-inositol-1(or 4)-monophosphatase
MTIPDGLSLLGPAAAIIREGGGLVIDLEKKGFSYEAKSEKNYVTNIDLAVEKSIVGRLRQLTPDYPVVTEETDSGPVDFDRPAWLLDPVDGTTNLMRGYRHSAISLALAAGGKVVAGLVYNPYTDELFTAAAGGGAKLNGTVIRASSRGRLADCLIGFGTTPYDRRMAHQTFEMAEKVFMASLEVRRSGSAALDLAYVACGRLDAFFEMALQPWDYAAGCLILQEAGGRAANWRGEMPCLRHGDSVLASNGLIHEEILKILNSIGV